MKFKEYDSVSELVDSLPNSEAVRKHMNETSFDAMMANCLFMMRTAAGLSQKEIAARLGVKQSSVSKMENGEKGLSFDETIRYLAAMGYHVELGILRGGGMQATLDYHVEQINRMLGQLSELAGTDPGINTGVPDAFRNVLTAIASSFIPLFAKKLDTLDKHALPSPFQISVGAIDNPKKDLKHRTAKRGSVKNAPVRRSRRSRLPA